MLEGDPDGLHKSLGVLPRYFVGGGAVGLALPGEMIEPRVKWRGEILSVGYKGGKEVLKVEIEIRLGQFSNGKIGKDMAELADRLRGDAVPEPERRGKGKRGEVLSLLDALSAMRLASWYPKSRPVGVRKSKGQIASRTAVERFVEIRLGRIEPGKARRKLTGELSEANFDRYARRGRKEFQSMFPFGESAANARSWAQRQCKPEGFIVGGVSKSA